MSEIICPMCPMVSLNKDMGCRNCGREWYWFKHDGEKNLASKPRKVQIVRPIVEGEKLDDCIIPVGDA